MELELFGTPSCLYTTALREQLIFERRAFTEYDVETDSSARDRMIALTGGRRTVPVLVEAGVVVRIGWNGRGCTVS